MSSGSDSVPWAEAVQVDARGDHLHARRIHLVTLDQDDLESLGEGDQSGSASVEGGLHQALGRQNHTVPLARDQRLLGPRPVEVDDEGLRTEARSEDRNQSVEREVGVDNIDTVGQSCGCPPVGQNPQRQWRLDVLPARTWLGDLVGPTPIRIVKTGVPRTSKAEAKSSRYLFKPPGFSWARASPTMRTAGRSEGTISDLVLLGSSRMILLRLAKPAYAPLCHSDMCPCAGARA